MSYRSVLSVRLVEQSGRQRLRLGGTSVGRHGHLGLTCNQRRNDSDLISVGNFRPRTW